MTCPGTVKLEVIVIIFSKNKAPVIGNTAVHLDEPGSTSALRAEVVVAEADVQLAVEPLFDEVIEIRRHECGYWEFAANIQVGIFIYTDVDGVSEILVSTL